MSHISNETATINWLPSSSLLFTQFYKYKITDLYSDNEVVFSFNSYKKSSQLLFWVNPLRGMRRDSESINIFFEPYFNSIIQSLDERDIICFSNTLEEIEPHELSVAAEQLVQ